jgi:hypothetical protein
MIPIDGYAYTQDAERIAEKRAAKGRRVKARDYKIEDIEYGYNTARYKVRLLKDVDMLDVAFHMHTFHFGGYVLRLDDDIIIIQISND